MGWQTGTYTGAPMGSPFDVDPESKKQAMYQGLLATGLGILANNQGNFGAAGPAIGRGGLIGLQAYQNQIQDQMQNNALKYRIMRDMIANRREDAQFSQQQQAQAELQDAINSGDEQKIKSVYAKHFPNEYAKGLFRPQAPEGPKVVGGALVSPDGKVIYQAPEQGMTDYQKAQLELERQKFAASQAGGGSDTPANIKEWEYFQKLSPQQQNAYLNMRRAQTRIDVGDSVVIPDPVNPAAAPVATFKKNLAPNDQPANIAAGAAAKVQGEAQGKRDMNMLGLGETIDRARSILEGKDPDTLAPAPKPTGSRLGAIYDSAAGLFGSTPEGAPQADKLEALAGSLTSKMPRMEGPQSNIDQENYKIMAGRVGDRNVPIERRLEALKEVERLYRKYDKSSPQPASEFTNAPIVVNTPQEAMMLPAGTIFQTPDGRKFRK